MKKKLLPNETWHALYIKSRHEKKVGELFDKFGIPYYLPIVKRLSLRKDRKLTIEEPLFRGYLFVPTDGINKEQVLQLPGVVAFVVSEGKHATIKREELLLIYTLIEKGYHMSASEDASFEKGETVTVNSGPLKGHSGQILTIQSESWLLVLVEGIGMHVKVRLKKENISKQLDPKEN
jgi:transcriptional antiterminator RfaH